MRWGFDRLSVEVVVEILSYLGYIDLLRCSAVGVHMGWYELSDKEFQVSKTVHSIIQDTPALQYTIELGMVGYNDGLASASVTDRLNYVRLQRKIWRHPVLERTVSIPVPSQAWFEAKSHKDVISGRGPGDHNSHQLDVMYLSTSVADDDRLKRLHFDVWFDALYIDPGQDLIVLVSLALAPDAA